MAITGTSLKKLRKEAGLTQKKLAQLVSVSQAHIAKIECGKVDPRLSTVNKIVQVLTVGKEKKCKDVMTKGVLSAKPNDSVLKISEIMLKHAISQLPVINGKNIIGTVTEETIIRNLRENLGEEKAKNVMGPPLPIVREDTNTDVVHSMLEKHAGVLVAKNKEILGIITRSDLLKTIR